EDLEQVVDLLRRQRQPPRAIGLHERRAAGRERHALEGPRGGVREQARHLGRVEQRHLGHAIEERLRERFEARSAEGTRRLEAVLDRAQTLEEPGPAKRRERRSPRNPENARGLLHFFSPGGVEYIGTGNCATVALPPSITVILAAPCFFTSSMRRIACIGRKVRFT